MNYIGDRTQFGFEGCSRTCTEVFPDPDGKGQWERHKCRFASAPPYFPGEFTTPAPFVRMTGTKVQAVCDTFGSDDHCLFRGKKCEQTALPNTQVFRNFQEVK